MFGPPDPANPSARGVVTSCDGHDLERRRLAALSRCALLDTSPEAIYDRITRLAARFLGVPVAMIVLLNRDRQWFKSGYGIEIRQASRQGSLCAAAMGGDGIFELTDATKDPRFTDDPLVAGPPQIRFYAAAPLTTADGHRIGALAVADHQPSNLQTDQRGLLLDLAGLVIEMLQRRSPGSRRRNQDDEREHTERALRQSEARLKDFAETASDWFWETDENLRFSYFSERYTAQTGETSSARIGKRRDEVALRDPHDDDWDDHLAKLAARQPFRDFVYAYQESDGGRRFAETSGTPIFNAHGQFRGYRGSARDITERRRAEWALRESEARYRKLVETAPDAIIITQRGRISFANSRASEILGAPSGPWLVGKVATEFADPVRRPQIEASLAGLRDGHPIKTMETVALRVDGTKVDVEVDATPTSISGTRAVQLVVRDISARKQAEAERVRLATVLAATSDMVAMFSPDLRLAYLNRAGQRMLGVDPDALMGRTMSRIFRARSWRVIEQDALPAALRHGTWHGENWIVARDGQEIPVSQVVLAHRDEGGSLAFVSTILRDISDRKRAEERIRHLAHHDELTGLPNRRLFHDRLEQSVALAVRQRHQVGVMMVDLDDFKGINDTLGHSIGDRLLRAVASRVGKILRASDTLARIGGDEFAIVQSGVQRADDAAALAQKVIDALAKPFVLGHREVHLAGSVGIALFPEDGRDHDQLLGNADLALYRAKKEGRGCWRFFDNSMQQELASTKALERDLRQALRRSELAVVYQPQLDPRTDRIVSAEALLRWRHPERGMIPPGDFIPMAETTGLIRPLGGWILDQACQQAKIWADSGHPLRIAVNLSPAEMRGDDLLNTVDRILQWHDLPAEFLEFEITERLFMEPSDGAIGACIRGLAHRGVRLAIDDFGTGYSSLAYLKRLPVSKIKIDKTFVHDIGRDADNEAVVLAVIGLAKSLGKSVIAEGVETESQLAFLRHHGCDEVQGFLLGAPTTASGFRQLLGAVTDSLCEPLAG